MQPASLPSAGAPAALATIPAEAAAPSTEAQVTLPTPTPESIAASAAAEAAPEAPAVAPAPDLAQVKIALTPVVDGLDQPVFVTHAGDGSGRLFIVEKTGKIQVLVDGALLPEPFLDVAALVSGGFEQGLLGLAFAPDFVDSGYFFVNYTDRSGDTVVARYQASAEPNRADPASAFVVLQVDQPAPNHNGGMLNFGPDGYLYVPLGDGGAANDRFGNGQNPATLLGKILRLDVTSDPAQPYVIPADNPFVAVDWNGQDVRDEVWVLGVRNPWRTSFDRATGDFWIADVGQNWLEEVDVIEAGNPGGLNLGWPIMEGKSCFGADACDTAGLRLPLHDYTHEGNCSVSGGYVYRGATNPAWNGVYFFGDWCSGKIWGLAPDGTGGWATAELLDSDLQITSFGEDEAGEIYVANGGGAVYRLEAAD
jgi:glucose/arabinose dehydrogenase